MAGESADEFRRREAELRAWLEPREAWRERGPADIAYTMEGLGVAPDAFAVVLDLAAHVTGNYCPAGIVVGGHRFGVGTPDQSTSGERLGLLPVALRSWPGP